MDRAARLQIANLRFLVGQKESDIEDMQRLANEYRCMSHSERAQQAADDLEQTHIPRNRASIQVLERQIEQIEQMSEAARVWRATQAASKL